MEFIADTPANGKAYYDAEKDCAIIVYKNKTKIFSGRRADMTGKYACNFEKETVIPSK